MALIEWNDDLSVGVALFDNQHKKLVEQLNTLHAAMLEGKSTDVLGSIFKELSDYTGYHFASEEDAFFKYGYPETDVHIDEHSKLLNKVADLCTQYKKGTLVVSIELLDFLRGWVSDHIMKTDKKYSSFLKGKAVP